MGSRNILGHGWRGTGGVTETLKVHGHCRPCVFISSYLDTLLYIQEFYQNEEDALIHRKDLH